MEKPKISVVMPVYNIEKYLDKSIESILNQTFKDFEFIIVFNGTTDNSIKIAKQYAKKDKRIKLVYLKKPDVQKAMNKGFEVAKGKYIARMDGDDLALPKRFEIQFNYLEKNPDVFLVGSSAIIIDEDGDKIGALRKFNNPKRIKRKLLKSNSFIHPSIMFRNTKEFFFREKFRASEDYDIYLRMLTSGKKITNLPNFLVKYRVRKNSFVSTMPNQHYYFKKAQNFYYQRLKSGKDDYKNLTPPSKDIFPKDSKKNSLRQLIFVKLQDGQSVKVRRNIKLYFHQYEFNRTLFFYYFLSFLPKSILNFIQERF